MHEDQLRFVIQHDHYLEGGTKEACVIARQFFQTNRTEPNDVELAAIRTLMAAAFIKPDEVPPDRWYCDNDCHYSRDLLCRGEMYINPESKNICPFFIDD